jgi:hypothetical protein
MSTNPITNVNPKITSVIKKKKEEQLLEASEQVGTEGDEAAQMDGLDTSNMFTQAPATTATDAADSSTVSTTGATSSAPANSSTALAGTGTGAVTSMSTGMVVAGIAGAAVVVSAVSSSSSSNHVPEDTTPPSAPSFSLATDSGASSADLITNVGTVNVTGLENGATWQYTLDSTAATPTWVNGTGTSVTLTDNATSFAVRQTDAAGNTSVASTGQSIVLDSSAPVIQSLTADGTAKTVTLTYSETLDATNIPETTAFERPSFETERDTKSSWSSTSIPEDVIRSKASFESHQRPSTKA